MFFKELNKHKYVSMLLLNAEQYGALWSSGTQPPILLSYPLRAWLPISVVLPLSPEWLLKLHSSNLFCSQSGKGAKGEKKLSPR